MSCGVGQLDVHPQQARGLARADLRRRACNCAAVYGESGTNTRRMWTRQKAAYVLTS